MFAITSSLATRLRDEVRQHPLREQEARRIVGMGGHYLTLADTDLAVYGLMALCTLHIDGEAYTLARTDGSRQGAAPKTEACSMRNP